MIKGTTQFRKLMEPLASRLFKAPMRPDQAATALIEYFVTMLTNVMLIEGKVSIRNFGKFEVRATPAQPPIKGGWRVVFTPSDILRRKIKERYMTDKPEYEEREKLGVVTTVPESGTKTSADATTCPKCGGRMRTDGNTPKCVVCGTEPFER